MNLDIFAKYPFIFSIAFCITYIATPFVRSVAQKLGFVDLPAARRIHRHPVPRCGGLGVFLGYQVASACVFFFPWSEHFESSLSVNWWYHCLLGSSILLVIGLIDDGRGLSWWIKLIGQIVVASAMFFLGVRFGSLQGMELPLLVNFILTVGWFLAFINAFNLIDGMDGLASGLALISACGLTGAAIFRHMPGDAIILIALVGTCFAFLRYNFHPATIFLGDSGSMFLGFILAAISLSTGAKGSILATVGVPLLAIGIPIFDTMLAIWRRSVRAVLFRQSGEPQVGGVMHADLEHLHHRLLRGGLNQRRTALLLYGANLVLVVIGLLSLAYHSQSTGIFLLSFVVGAYVVVRYIASVELWDSGTMILRGLSRPSSSMLPSILYPIYDAIALTISLASSIYLVNLKEAHHLFKQVWFDSAPLWCGIPFTALFLSGIYRRVWSKARVSEFVSLVVVILASVSVSLSLTILAGRAFAHELFLQAVLYFSFASFALTGIRMLPRAIQDLMGVIGRHRGQLAANVRNVLVYGAGSRAILYLRRQVDRVEGSRHSSQIIGLIDDDRFLRKRFVHGYQVIGCGHEIPDILQNVSIDEIVLAAELSEDQRKWLVMVAQSKNIVLTEWAVEEKVLYVPQDSAPGLQAVSV